MMMSGEVDLRALLGLLRRQVRLIAITVLLIVSGATVAAFTLTPIYSATALILVDPSNKNLLDPESARASAASASIRIDSEVEILRSDSLLLSVIESERLVENPEWGHAPGWRERAARAIGLGSAREVSPEEATAAVLVNLRRAYTAERRALTQVIALQVRSENPQAAAELVNTIAKTYIARQIEAKIDSTLGARELLLSRLIQARSELSAIEQALGEKSTQNGGEATKRAEIARAHYDLLLQRAEELEAEAALQVADSRIVSPAPTPQIPAFPNKTVIVVVAAIFAFGAGVALAFLRENLIGGFTSEEQLVAVLRPTAATAIPRGRIQGTAPSLADLMVTTALSGFSESVRRLRAAIDHYAGKQLSGHVIMVSSANRDEGKTTLSLALARAYALSGRRTLLIDCDLREPGLHHHFDVTLSHGLRDFLDPKATAHSLTSIAAHDPLTEATLIGGATHSDVPTDQLLAGVAFARLIDAARTSFEVVILDTPPLGPLVDGLYAAAHADTIVFIARWASTGQTDARKAIESLHRAARPQTPVIAVLNQRHEPRPKAYRYKRNYQEA
jgi:capsular exopolysaccharide synthesis family protein